MSALQLLSLLFLLGFGSNSGAPGHPKVLMAGRPRRITTVECSEDPATPWTRSPLHWYRLRADEAPQRVLYFQTGSSEPVKEKEFGRFSGTVKAGRSSLTFSADGDATYFCATWSGDNTVARCGATPHQNPTQTRARRRRASGKMARLLGCVFIPLCLLSGACSGAARHPKAAVASKPTRAARVECVEDPAVPWASNALHWYRARDGEAPQRVLHFSAGAAKAQRESGFVRFSASITGTTSTLTVTDARTDDAATYYCATRGHGGPADHPRRPRLLQAGRRIVLHQLQNQRLTCLCPLVPEERLRTVPRSPCGVPNTSSSRWRCSSNDRPDQFVQALSRRRISTCPDPKGIRPTVQRGETDMRLLPTKIARLFVLGGSSVGNVKEFGSGTRLFVTVLPVKPPTVTVYSPSRPQQDNVSLVCRASGMSPDYGVFHWKVYEDGGWADVRDTSIVEQHDQDAGVRTSMMVVSKQDVSSKRYGCLVAHEQSSNVKEIRQGEDSGKDDESKTRMEETSGNAEPGATCAPGDEATLTWDQIDGGFKAGLSLNLASLAYTVMVSKCLVYFSLVSTLLLTRKTAREPSVSRRQPGDLQRRKYPTGNTPVSKPAESPGVSRGTMDSWAELERRRVSGSGYSVKRFASGTRLVVSESSLRKPTVSVYGPSDPAADRVTMLCRASDMFPNVVRISWMFRQAGGWVGVSQAAEKPEVLEAEGQDPSSRSSVMVLAREQAERNHYRCEVEHEMGKEGRDMDTDKDGTGPAGAPATATCPPAEDAAPTPQQNQGDFKAGLSLNLATLAYTVMISKCLVYFSLVSTLLLTRRTAKIQSFHRNRIS
ncbi:uncharacterized protein LOC114787720 [Denticeps clupeoides]|uniref:uncharacterized protein LOC114787720 n=1 Tax=Denticeps clupeoides TaxID=299321 RepID=UPI0010A49365|nr:uncharacterized protein LOC114787720 [Denticeps clupeoides]